MENNKNLNSIEENGSSMRPLHGNTDSSPEITNNPPYPEKQETNAVNRVRNDLQEQVRAIILELLGKEVSKMQIGQKVGISGQYVSMLLNYKYFPKKAENQVKLLKKFQELRKKEIEVSV